MLVFFNDAAELLIGKPFAEVGISAIEFGAVLELTELDGSPVRRRRQPRRDRVLPAAAVAPAAARDRVRRRPPHGGGHRLPAVRRGRRDARRGLRVLGRRAATGRADAARVWGCRGSVAAPGADTVRYGGNTSCVEVRLESGHVARARRGHRHAAARRRARRRRRRSRAPHPPHPPAPRPSPGPRVLPAAVPARNRRAHLGTGVAGAVARRADRDLPLAAAVPRTARRYARERHLPRRATRTASRSARRRSCRPR